MTAWAKPFWSIWKKAEVNHKLMEVMPEAGLSVSFEKEGAPKERTQ